MMRVAEGETDSSDAYCPCSAQLEHQARSACNCKSCQTKQVSECHMCIDCQEASNSGELQVMWTRKKVVTDGTASIPVAPTPLK